MIRAGDQVEPPPGEQALHVGLMLVLTFSTGIVDAIGFLGLDRVFVGSATGNVVILGMALSGADDLPVVSPALTLAAFMAGAAGGGRVLRRSAPAWTGRVTAVLGAVALILASVGFTLLVLGDSLPRPAVLAITSLLGLAMGGQAAAARFIAVKDVTTVVVTSTLTGLASDSTLGAGRSQNTPRRVLAVLLMTAGAATGAMLLQWNVGAGLVLSGVLTLIVTCAGALLPGRVTGSPPRSGSEVR